MINGFSVRSFIVDAGFNTAYRNLAGEKLSVKTGYRQTLVIDTLEKRRLFARFA